jgi:hypothetical protein
MLELVLVATLATASPGGPRECGNPPARASEFYWDYIESCGCAKLDPPSRASSDYSRYMKACSQWRERNQGSVAAGSDGTASDAARPGRECEDPPSRVSPAYWTFIDACGCAKVDPPSSSSSDYPRYLKACGEWREKNPALAPTPSPTATPPTAKR